MVEVDIAWNMIRIWIVAVFYNIMCHVNVYVAPCIIYQWSLIRLEVTSLVFGYFEGQIPSINTRHGRAIWDNNTISIHKLSGNQSISQTPNPLTESWFKSLIGQWRKSHILVLVESIQLIYDILITFFCFTKCGKCCQNNEIVWSVISDRVSETGVFLPLSVLSQECIKMTIFFNVAGQFR